MISALILSATFLGAADCANGKCYTPSIRIRVPGARIDIGPSRPPIRIVAGPVPYRRPMVYRRGWFGKWKIKTKWKMRSR